MKIIKQATIILGVNFLGEGISYILHLPVPGSITGMILFLVFLLTGVIKEYQVAETADFFLNNMGFFFIPAGVSVLVSHSKLRGNYINTLLVIILSTIIVAAVTSLITQMLIKIREKRNGKIN